MKCQWPSCDEKVGDWTIVCTRHFRKVPEIERANITTARAAFFRNRSLSTLRVLLIANDKGREALRKASRSRRAAGVR